MSEEDYIQSPNIPECGGPLVCVGCAMKYSEFYMSRGQTHWGNVYHNQAAKLQNENEILRLKTENQFLLEKFVMIQQDLEKLNVNSETTP